MELLKKIGLFVVLFVTLSQAMGNSTFRFEEKLVVLENNENGSPSNEYFSLELDEIEDENSVITSKTFSCASRFEQSFIEKESQFNTSFNLAFWQPPKIS